MMLMEEKMKTTLALLLNVLILLIVFFDPVWCQTVDNKEVPAIYFHVGGGVAFLSSPLLI